MDSPLTRGRALAWRAWAWLRRRTLEREMDEELRLHRELLARDLEHQGLAPEEAHRAATVRLGNARAIRERSAEWWGFPRFESVMQDVRYGARMLRKSPGFALVAIGATGLAIGINAGFFTLVDSIMLKPIPVADAASLVKLVTVVASHETSLRFSVPEYRDIAARARALRDVTAFASARFALADPSGTTRAVAIGAGIVSGNYFTALGGTAQLGRALVPSDDAPGASPAIVISDRLWRSRFGGTTDIVGRDVVVDGAHVSVAGVIRGDFIGVTPIVPDVWMPISVADIIGAVRGELSARTNRFLVLHGHLRDGVSRAQAAADVSRLVAEPVRRPGVSSDDRVVRVIVLPQSSMVPLDVQTAFIALPGFVAVGLVLVIACANLATLLLARALARQREVSVRLAVGASRARLVRQLLTESALIAIAGGALGLLLANWTVTATTRAVVDALPFTIGTVMLEMRPSGRVYAAATAMVAASVFLFGLVPALHGTTIDLNASLKGEDRLFGTRLRRSRFRDALVVGQVAACVVLCVAAGTFVRSFANGMRMGGSLDIARVSVATLGLRGTAIHDSALSTARAQLAARMARLPGVERTASASEIPYAGAWSPLHVGDDGSSPIRAMPHAVVTPGYFDVIGQPIARGRRFTANDSATGARVAIVTSAAARVLWPGRDAVGRTMRIVRATSTGRDTTARVQIIGVAADAHSGSLFEDDATGYVYLLATPAQVAAGDLALLVRRRADVSELEPALARIAADVAPLAPFETMPVSTMLRAQTMPFRYAALIATTVGAIGLALAGMGLYAVVAFSVRQRQREIAVRVALGAAARDVIGAVLRREMQLVGVGLAVGILVAFAESALLTSSEIPLTPVGGTAFVAIPAALLGAALLATLAPVRRALRVDPMQSLRSE